MTKVWQSSSLVKKLSAISLSFFITFGLTISLTKISEDKFISADIPSSKPLLRILFDLTQSSSTNYITTPFLLVVLFYICLKAFTPLFQNRFFTFLALFAALAIGWFSVMAISFQHTGTWELVINSSPSILLKGLIKWFSITLLVWFLIALVSTLNLQDSSLFTTIERLPQIEKKRYWQYFATILLAWGVYLIALFPGTASWDTLNQFAEYFGENVSWVYPTSHYLLHAGQITISDHHPFLLTYLYGFLIKVGAYLHHPHLGIFAISFFQTLLTISIFSYSLIVFRRLSLSGKYIKVILLSYCFFPLFPLYAIYQVKNSLYGPILLWFCLLILQVIKDDTLWKDLTWRIMLISNLLLQIITIKYGIYIALFTGICLLFFQFKNWKSICLLFLLPIMIFKFSYTGLAAQLKVIPGDPIEMYAIPLQQTGRYVRDHPDDLSSHEKKVLSKVFVLKNIASTYNPQSSDYMKTSGSGSTYVYRFKTVTKQDLHAYHKVWLQMFFKHPGTYFEAFFNQTYAYLSLFPDKPLHAQDLSDDTLPLNHTPWHNNSVYQFKSHHQTFTMNANYGHQPLRDFLIGFINLLLSIPLISLLFRGTTFVFLTILITLLTMFSKKAFSYFPVVAPILLQLGICILSPINGSQRYMYPFIYCAPFLVVVLTLVLREMSLSKNTK